MRKLASIRKVKDIKSIPNADKICAYQIDGWWVVDGIGKYNIGDLVIYFEIDSFLPIKPEYEFLRKSSYRQFKETGEEGFKLKTVKLRGQCSQGLIMPLTFDAKLGDDVTELLGVKKYDPPLPPELDAEVKGKLPAYIQMTDEERIQNLNEEDFYGKPTYISEKLEGTSTTFYMLDGEFGVCGRTLDYKRNPKHAMWKFAIENELEDKLGYLNKNIAIQGELIGPGIQKNIYKLNTHTVRFFTVFDIDTYSKVGYDDFVDVINEIGLEPVPLLERGFILPTENLTEYMLEFAEGKSVLNPETEREGVVVRAIDGTFSFKCISNKYLIKHETRK